MKCTEKWFKQQLQEKRNELEKELAELLPKQDNPNYPILDIDMEIAFVKSKIKLIDDVLGLLVEREKELQEICEKCKSEATAEGMTPECEEPKGSVWTCSALSPKEILGDV